MSINLMTPDARHMLTQGMLQLQTGEIQSHAFNTEYQSSVDQASLYTGIAYMRGHYYFANPVAVETLTRNGFPFAEGRRGTLDQMATTPALIVNPKGTVSKLLEDLSPNMEDDVMAIHFKVLKDTGVWQESRRIVNYGTGAFTYLAPKRVASPVKLMNVRHSAAFVLSYLYPQSTFEVINTLIQNGDVNDGTAVPARYTYDIGQRLKDALDSMYAIKMAQAQAEVTNKGTKALAEPLAAPLFAAWSRRSYEAQLAGQTIVLDDTPGCYEVIRLLLELALASMPILSVKTSHNFLQTKKLPTPLDVDYLAGVYDAAEVVYNHLPDYGTRKTYIAYRYLVRGGRDSSYTIAGTPMYERIEYQPGDGPAFSLGGRAISTLLPEFTIAGAAQGKPLDYARTWGAGGMSNIKTTVAPSSAVLYDELPLQVGLTDKEMATAIVEFRRIGAETLANTFYVPRNWKAKDTLGSTVIGTVEAALGKEVKPYLGNVDMLIPLFGPKLTEGGIIKAESPLTDYTIQLTSSDDTRVYGYPTVQFTAELQRYIRGRWTMASQVIPEIATNFVVGA